MRSRQTYDRENRMSEGNGGAPPPLLKPEKRKRQRLDSELDRKTCEKATSIAREIQEDYGEKMRDLDRAYGVAAEQTKKDSWERLIETLGGGMVDYLKIEYNNFFEFSDQHSMEAPLKHSASGRGRNGFSMLPKNDKKRAKPASGPPYFKASVSFDDEEEDDYDEEGEKKEFYNAVESEVEEEEGEEEAENRRATLRALASAPDGILARYFPNNQYTVKDGSAACTAIAFAAAYRMSLVSDIERLEKGVKWNTVLILGSRLWELWARKYRSVGSRRRFISIEDIRNMPITTDIFGKVWNTLGNIETEKGGFIDDKINEGKEAATNLRDALLAMPAGSDGTPATAVICAGSNGGLNSSVAVWKSASGNYALYDSHEGLKQDQSTLWLMRDLNTAVLQLKKFLNQMPKETLERPVEEISESVMYSMHILHFEFTNTANV